MIRIELPYTDDYYDKDPQTAKEFLPKLKQKYPIEYREAVSHLREFYNKTAPNYDFRDMITSKDLIEEIDDLLEDEYIVNYYVQDTCGTDKGEQSLILENGYLFKWEA